MSNTEQKTEDTMAAVYREKIIRRINDIDMSKEQSVECAEQLKLSAKELIDGISTDTELGQRVIKLIYGFVRSGFLECKAEKGGVSA